jgi:hypothetical protein
MRRVGVNELVTAAVNMNPNGAGLPGGPVIQQLTDGIGQ